VHTKVHSGGVKKCPFHLLLDAKAKKCMWQPMVALAKMSPDDVLLKALKPEMFEE
jgi:hypothetical protein